MMKKILDVLKSVSAILAAIILIIGQFSEIGESVKTLKETFTGCPEPENSNT